MTVPAVSVPPSATDFNNAAADLQDLADILNGGPTATVTNRNGDVIPSVQKVLAEGAGSFAAAAATATNAASSATTAAAQAQSSASAAAAAASYVVNRPAVRLATLTPLPAATYSNGTSGVGATLTMDATGVLTVDGVAVAINDDIVIAGQATQLQNGIYRCTTAGATGVAAVLTRRTTEDTPAELGSACMQVTAGTNYAGWVFRVEQASGAITIGTTAITAVGMPAATAAEAATRAAADTTIHTALDPIAAAVDTSYVPRSGWLWALVDSARRIMLGLDSSERLQVYSAAVFRSSVQFLQSLQIASARLGDQPVEYLSGYTPRSGWLWARIDSASKVLLGQKYDLTLWSGGRRLLFADESPNLAALYPAPNVADAWGDSLTAGGWPGTLAGLIGGGFSANNYGVGSQKSTQIAMRAGAVLAKLTVSGNAIPAAGTPVSVTAINGVALAGMATNQDPDYRFLSAAAGNGTTSAGGYLCGVHGTLTRTATGGPPSTLESYTFTPDTGTGVACPAGSVFTPDIKAQTVGHELWICVGRNNYGDTTAIKADIAALVALARPVYKRIMIFSVLNGDYSGEYLGNSAWATITQLNADLRSLYPSYYAVNAQGQDLREYLVSLATSSTQDITDRNRDIPPTSLRSDNIHLNSTGYAAWAAFAKAFRDIQSTLPS